MAKILVVEDEWIVADDIRKSLKDSGYTVSVVSSGEETLEKVENPKTRPDLIIMDIVLKGALNGTQLAHSIHSHFDIPVVYLTAHADEDTLKQAKTAEPYGYIVKPFEDRELHATIEMALYKHEMEKKVKESKEWLEKRIEERSRRTEILLTTRQSLQKEKNWETGLVIIAECMAQLGFERYSIFLVNPFRKTLDYLYGKGDDLQKGTSISLNSTEYFGVRCILEKRTIYMKEYSPRNGKQVTSESESFVWVPIIVQNEAFAALAADNALKSVTDEDVKDLEILAGMCAAFIDRTRVLIESVPEKMLDTEVKHWLDPMEAYIVLEKEPEKSFEMFCDLITHGVPGFVISREYPEKLKKKYSLVKTPVLWLSRFETGTTVDPDSIPKLIYIIRDFTKKSEESVILIDGLEYLITHIDFKTVLTYLQELKDIVAMNNSRLIIPLHKDVLSVKDFSMLEKEFKIL